MKFYKVNDNLYIKLDKITRLACRKSLGEKTYTVFFGESWVHINEKEYIELKKYIEKNCVNQ